MALGVRILYPDHVDEAGISVAARFINYNNKYLTTEDAVVKATLRIRAKSYDNFGEAGEIASITDPIAYIQISNDSNFSTDRTLTLPYTEGDQYDLSSLTGYTGSPIITAIGLGDPDVSLNIMRITNWVLDTGEGPKTIYIRFITGGAIPYTFPATTETIKGWWDTVIVVKTAPSMPTFLNVDNETSNHYVGKTTTLSWIEAEDNISGLRGYNVDLELSNDIEIIEECNNLNDFEISDAYINAYRILNNLPVMNIRYSNYSAGEYTFSVIPGQSKLQANFYKTGATPHGHELQFENYTETDEFEQDNYIFEAKIQPTTTTGANGTQYMSIQNFFAMYNTGSNINELNGFVIIDGVNGSAPYGQINNLDAVIDIDAINGSGTYYSINSLSAKMYVVPPKNSEPIYIDMANVHTNINNWNGAGSDFILFEIDEDGAYHYVRPTWDGNELMTGYTRTTLSTSAFASQISPNDINQEIEIAYRENRSDIEIKQYSDFGWFDILPISNTSTILEPESFTILWQKVKCTKDWNGSEKIQILINSDENRDRLVWFSLIIAPDGSMISNTGISGLPCFNDNITDGNRKTNYTGIATDIAYLYQSCRWDDADTYPQFNNSYYRRWNETILVTPGRNIINFAASGFTGTSITTNTFNEGWDYWIGIVAVSIKDNTDMTTEANWEFSNYRPNLQWLKISKPLYSYLPETLIMARNRSQNITDMSWVSEYKGNTHTTNPGIFRFISSGVIKLSTFPDDLNSDYAELIVNWNQVGSDSISRLMDSHVYTIPRLKGSLRNFLTGFRNSSIPVSEENSIIYDDIRFSDNSLISNIDLSDNVGYEKQSLDLDDEDIQTVTEQTVWAETDWNRVWSKHYGNDSGATISIDADKKLNFEYSGSVADSVVRSAETHYLTPSGSKTCEIVVRFDLSAYNVYTEFYVVFSPIQYESTFAEVNNINLEGNPDDLLIVGFHYNGDIYLYRPNETTGDISFEIVYTLGQLEDFNWNTSDIKIRVDNGILQGTTSISIWHGDTLLYNNDYMRLFLPDSDSGYYTALGFRGKRDPENTLSLDTGNFSIKEVDPSNYDSDISTIYSESMQGVPSRWWAGPGIEQINLTGATPSGSWFLAGTTNPVADSEIAKYSVAHRKIVPYNVVGTGTTATGIDPDSTIGQNGLPDYSRFSMYINIDDIQTAPEFTSISRWIGAYLMMGDGIKTVEAGEAYRWDFNYSLSYPEADGDSEVIFGIANWLPTNEPATNSGKTFTTHQDYAVYSFDEDDLTENTKASVYALSGTDTISVGLTNGQYDTSNPARYAIFSFVSDGVVKYTKGRLTSSGSSIDAATDIGNSILPTYGKISIIILPKNTPGSLNPIVTLTADDSDLNSGESTTLRWQSTNATYVDYNNFDIESDELTGSKIITPAQSTDYTIRVKNDAGASATATVRINVTTIATNAPVINAFAASQTSIESGDTSVLSWNVSNPSSGTMTVYLNGGQFSNQVVSAISSINVSPTSDTIYTLTATNDKGSVSKTLQISIQQAGSLSVTLASSSYSITNGGAVTLTWSTTPSTGVSLISSNFGATATSGTITKYPSETVSYTITIKNNSTNETKTATVTIVVGGYASGVSQYISPIYLGVNQVRTTILPGASNSQTTNTFGIQEINGNHIYLTKSIQYKNPSPPVEYTSELVLKDNRYYYYLIPGPWLPGSSYNIINAGLTLTASREILYYGTPVIAMAKITNNWDSNITSLPTLDDGLVIFNQSSWGILSTIVESDYDNLFVSGSSLFIDNRTFKNYFIDWNNNQLPNYGIIMYCYTGGNTTTNVLPDDIFSTDFLYDNSYASPTIASPNHPTLTWRPYWTITYSGVGSSSVKTLRVPVGGAFAEPYQMIRMQTTTPPQYADVHIYVDNTLYISQTDVPLNFNTSDGIRLFVSARRKTPGEKFNTSAIVSKFSLTLVNQRVQPSHLLMNDLALWSKTGGVLPSNTLFYGRNIDVWQDESYASNMVSGNSILAQGFIPTHSRIGAVSLKVDAETVGEIVAYIVAADSNDEPDITPVSNHIVKNDTNIIATSWAKVWPNMKEAMFTFQPAVNLTAGTLYYIVFDYLTSAYGTSDASLMPSATIYRWATNQWTSVDGVLAFRVFPDIYINTFNDLHAQRQDGRVASINNAGLVSDFTSRTTEITIDILPPHHPVLSSNPQPTLYLQGYSGYEYVDNYGSLMNLRIGAIDTDVVGSGIQDFRFVYWGNFNELLSTDFYKWNDDNSDNYIDISINYPGLFMDTKKVYAQVRDKTGNMSETNSLYVNFKYAFFEDTEAPYFVRLRIDGDATIDPDPDEHTVTKDEITNDSLVALDKWTGPKDFRINHNFETSIDTGKLIYGNYQPYVPNFIDTISGDDGVYVTSVQVRDYGDNATQEHIEHIKTIEFENQTDITELPTFIIRYQPQLQSYIYIATTQRRNRENISCTNSEVSGYSVYTIYEPWVGNTRQTFKSTETIIVKVNGSIVSDSEYTVDASNDRIIFNNSLSQYDVVTMDIIEEVAILYRYENGKYVIVKMFDKEGERAIGSMAIYNNTLYIGTDSGRIYAYNGIRTSSSLYRVSDGAGNYIPISKMKVFKFVGEDREYLYVSTYKSAQLFRYGGNVANTNFTWNRLSTVATAMSGDDDVFDIESYNNILFLATGPYGKVYRYQRVYDSVGNVTESIVAKQLYSDEFDDDISFRMNVLCLKEFDDKIFAGVDYNSSIFNYQYFAQEQPKITDWKEHYLFNNNFNNSPNPWEFYNNGNVDHNNTDRLIFNEINDTNGDLLDWSMQINGEPSEYCLWVNKDTDTTWQSVDNTTGWMIEFEYQIVSYSNIDSSYQSLKVFDGKYEMEIQLFANNTIKLVSGDSEASANVTSIANMENNILNVSDYEKNYIRLRINVKGKTVTIYQNGDNVPIIDESDFLSIETKGKTILFGKNNVDGLKCYTKWRYLYYYISGILVPVLTIERDFTRDQVITFGKEVRYLQEVSEIPIDSTDGVKVNRLIAGIEPRNPSSFVIQDDPSTLIPRTYVRETGNSPVWSYDASYPTNCVGIVGAIVDNNILMSISEITDDSLTYNPFYINSFMINDPYIEMERTGNIYYRRRTQAYDSIIKDTHSPEGGIIIGEATSAGAVQVYAFEIYDKNNKQITDGYAARYSALDIEVDVANNATDGDPDTYDVIGTSEIRYLQQTFSETTTVKLQRIKWGCKSNQTKTYRIEYLDTDNEWQSIVEMQTDPDNINIFFDYILKSEVSAYAIRIYYTGDAETVQDSNYVTLSAHDAGIGVSAYRISSYQDFRDSPSQPGADVNGWIPMTDGIITINWNLISSSSNWITTETTDSPITAAIVFGDILVVGSQDGKVYISSDGSTFIESATSFGNRINSFVIWRDVLYLATDNAQVWQSDNGLDWGLTTALATNPPDIAKSLCVFNDILYIGSGDSGKLYSWDSDTDTTTLIKQFSSSIVSSLYEYEDILYIGLYPTGEIYTYDGENFNQAVNLPSNNVNQFTYFDNKIFAACGNGKIYQYTNNGWSLLFDSSIRNIIGEQTFTNTGPEILSIVEDGAGYIGAGNWRYKITYIDNAGIESSSGESYEVENTTNNGRLLISWQEIDNAVGYRIYRCPTVNGIQDSERLMIVNSDENIIEDTYFLDNGLYTIYAGQIIGKDSEGKDITNPDTSPPITISNYLWFAGDYDKVYIYDKKSMSEVDLPTGANGANGIIQFKGQIYVFGQNRPYTTSELALLYDHQTLSPSIIGSVKGNIIKYIGTGAGSGYKTVYCQYKDSIDNVSNVLSDRIFYNNLIQKQVIEVEDSTGSIIDSYSSNSSPTQKLYSPSKNYEQTGIYESEPFFAANLSRWDVIELVSQLPYNTYVDLYVRTATTRDGLETADWNGPFELDNPNLEYDYYPYYGYYYSSYYNDYYYMDYSYYREDEGIVETLSADISYLSGQWIQFKLILRTANRYYTPKVFSIVIKYISTNAAMFYTTIFDLYEIANRERERTGDFEISRGVLTWNGVIPSGGDVQFGISTQNLDSYDWADYQIITPNQVFEVDNPGQKFRIASVLVSTDQETAIIDEWAILFECGDKDIKVNLNQYNGVI